MKRVEEKAWELIDSRAYTEQEVNSMTDWEVNEHWGNLPCNQDLPEIYRSTRIVTRYQQSLRDTIVFLIGAVLTGLLFWIC